jgi:hypothetical protein
MEAREEEKNCYFGDF